MLNESENSIFINPNNADNAINSNNSGLENISSNFYGPMICTLSIQEKVGKEKYMVPGEAIQATPLQQ